MLLSSAKKGIYLKSHKATRQMSVMPLTLPAEVRIPMTHGRAASCRPLVKAGDKVGVGQLIGEAEGPFAVPVHSSVSGTVTGIEELPSRLGMNDLHVVIKTDGRQSSAEDLRPPVIGSREEFLRAVRDSGLVGLGGEGFPTALKLDSAGQAIDSLLLNGAECEPFVTSDHRNMVAYARELVQGAAALMRYLSIRETLIGVQADKQDALDLIAAQCEGMDSINAAPLSRIFPAGEETLLIRELRGTELPLGGRPADKNILVLNVSTVIKLEQYLVTGMPLVSRTVTVDGDVIARPMNVEVPIGTAMGEVLRFCGADEGSLRKLIAGGPMTGTALPDTGFYTTKTDNALICFSAYRAERDRETACINCGRCIDSCPEGLLPGLLFKAWRERDEKALRDGLLSACSGCGCCSYVCPARKQISFELGLAKQFLMKKESENAEGGSDER